MKVPSQKNRIIFIDILRAFAVFMMMQGHTIDVLLKDVYRNDIFIPYYIWNFMRGLTAPIFMFSSGTIFSFLFKAKNIPFNENPRVKKGIKRFFMLMLLGYALRYPTPHFNFSNIPQAQWQTFYAVDVLQLIGCSILILVILEFLADKLKLNIYGVFTFFILFFFAGNIYTNQIEWRNILPIQIAGYMYKGTGSNFPLFPWVGFVIAGGLLGNYLAIHKDVYKSKKFPVKLLILSMILECAGVIEHLIEVNMFKLSDDFYWGYSVSLMLIRLGLVFLLASIISYIALKIKKLPKIIILLGQNTLVIYAVHVIILYGCAWTTSVSQYYAKSFDVIPSILSAIAMIILMSLMVVVINNIKMKYKNKTA